MILQTELKFSAVIFPDLHRFPLLTNTVALYDMQTVTHVAQTEKWRTVNFLTQSSFSLLPCPEYFSGPPRLISKDTLANHSPV